MAKLVNWFNFHKKIREKELLLFSARDICVLFGSSAAAVDFLLHRYAKKGYIVRLKRGIYALPDFLPPDTFIANKLYEPSYLSLSFALSYHQIIPENVYEYTSITTKPTRRFEILGKIYSYRRIKKSALTGYSMQMHNGIGFLIADKEKAFVDEQYFRILEGRESLARFKKENIDRAKTFAYSLLFNNPRLTAFLKKSLL